MRQAYLFFCMAASSTGLLAQNWEQWGQGSGRNIHTLYTDTVSNTLYACNREGTSYGILRWNGMDWDTLGTDLNGPVSRMVRHEGRLCISSNRFVLRWNGAQWDTLGSGHANFISDLEVFNGELYALGELAILSVWNGTDWIPQNVPWTLSSPRALQTFDGELYVSGFFQSEHGSNIIRWNGAEWNGLGNGIPWLNLLEFGIVHSKMAVYDSQLYITSNFLQQQGNPDDHIARWDGVNWLSVGGGLNDMAYMFAVYHDELYVTGWFSEAGGIQVPRIAKWDGMRWCDLGISFSGGFGGAITVYNGDLILGGGFTEIDGIPTNRIAKWTGGNYVDTCGAITGIGEIGEGRQTVSIHPNPTPGPLTVTSKKPLLSVAVVDMLGRVLLSEHGNASSTIAMDLSHLPAGIYVVHVETDAGRWAQRVVKQ